MLANKHCSPGDPTLQRVLSYRLALTKRVPTIAILLLAALAGGGDLPVAMSIHRMGRMCRIGIYVVARRRLATTFFTDSASGRFAIAFPLQGEGREEGLLCSSSARRAVSISPPGAKLLAK